MNLKKLVNDKDLWKNFMEYLDNSIEQQQRVMEQAEDSTILYRAQGAISSLRRLKYLKDEMNGES